MLSRKKKHVLVAIGSVVCLTFGSLQVHASSYVNGSVGGKTCTGLLKYDATSKSLIATTTCPGLTGVSFRTTVSGEFSNYGVSLGSQSKTERDGEVKITESRATGYITANGFHEAFYASDEWGGGTNI